MLKFDYEYTEFIRHPYVRLFVVDLAHCHVHMHKEFEMCYVLSGEVEVNTSGLRKCYIEGQCILFNSRQVHELYASRCSSTMLLILQISPAFCIHYFPEINNVSFDSTDVSGLLDDEQNSRLTNLLCTLSEHFFNIGQYSPFQCAAYTNFILCLLLERLPWHHISEAEKTNQQIVGNRLYRIVTYIETHYSEKILLKDVADNESLSLGYLSHFFRNYFGLSFQQYVSKLRFERARRLLIRTDMSLTEVCVASGFPDCRQMRKIFLELASCIPEDYRDKLPEESGLYIARPVNSIERELNHEESLNAVRKLFN